MTLGAETLTEEGDALCVNAAIYIMHHLSAVRSVEIEDAVEHPLELDFAQNPYHAPPGFAHVSQPEVSIKKWLVQRRLEDYSAEYDEAERDKRRWEDELPAWLLAANLPYNGADPTNGRALAKPDIGEVVFEPLVGRGSDGATLDFWLRLHPMTDDKKRRGRRVLLANMFEKNGLMVYVRDMQLHLEVKHKDGTISHSAKSEVDLKEDMWHHVAIVFTAASASSDLCNVAFVVDGRDDTSSSQVLFPFLFDDSHLCFLFFSFTTL